MSERQGIPDTEEEELIGSSDRLDFLHAAAAVCAEGERLRAAMDEMAAQLSATRQFLRVTQEDRHRVLGVASEVVQLARATAEDLKATAEDVGVIREVVTRMDELVADLTKRVQAIKLPKWLGSLTAE